MRNTVGLFFIKMEGFLVVKKTLKEIEKLMLKEKEIDVTDVSSLSIELEHLSPQYRIEPPEPFTLDQMIKKLEEKKLYFPENNSKKKCIDLLNTLGYYNLKHFINNEFEKDEEKNFDSIYSLYEFDRYLSKQLYSLLNTLEVHIRNLILEVYMLEIEERELPPSLFYLDKSIYFEKVEDEYKITNQKRYKFNKLQSKFANAIDQKRNNENIKHNLKKYEIIPAWVLFQSISFGELSMFYTYTLSKNKNIVCKKIEGLINENLSKKIKIPYKLFGGWCNNIRYLRNKIAHTDIIYGVNLIQTCAEHREDAEYFKRLNEYNYQQRLVTFLLAMQKIFMSMPKYCIDLWNDTLDDIQLKVDSDNNIKLSRIGVLDNNVNYLKIDTI